MRVYPYPVAHSARGLVPPDAIAPLARAHGTPTRCGGRVAATPRLVHGLRRLYGHT